ncbi:unnamed protein product, partial [Sphacelaria rigidula]
DGLRAQLARTKAARQKVNARSEQLREQIQKSQKSERRCLHHLEIEEGASSKLGKAPGPTHGTVSRNQSSPGLPAVAAGVMLTATKDGAARRADTRRVQADIEEE